MGQTTVVNVAKRAYDVDVSPQFDGYSNVRIYVGENDDGTSKVFEATDGSDNGRVLEMQNDFGTQEMADNILTAIRGYQYQPYSADNALLDPAAEMGDGVTVNGVYSGVFARATQFGRLMASNIAAPTDEEIAHEYSTDTSPENRAFTRLVGKATAGIYLTQQAIEAEVTRATEAEGELRASITETADEISAEVSNVQTSVDGKLNHTRTNSTFGWQLTSTSFKINANGNQNIFYADKNGIKIRGNAEVTGTITATSGYIGNGSNGFSIGATSIYNGKTTLTDENDGIYIGTNGIALGADSAFRVTNKGVVTMNSGSINIGNGNFKVTSDGIVVANDLRLKGGQLNVGGNFIVNSKGDLTANNGTFKGTVYAGKITYGTTEGYFNGAGIGNKTIYGAYKLATGSVTGGVDDWGNPTGSLGANTVYGGNIGYSTVTTDNTNYGINTSLGYANTANNIFNGYNTATYMKATFSTFDQMTLLGYDVRWSDIKDGDGVYHKVLSVSDD